MPEPHTHRDDLPHPLPVAVIGCGRMGRLHARVYAQMPQVKLVGVHDANPDAARSAASDYNCEPYAHLDELLPHVSAVTIATPTQFHTGVAETCLRQGIACLIEKPIAKSVAEAQQIVDWSKQFGVPVQVGHIERFNPAVRAMEKLQIHPRFMEVVRVSPMTFRSIDVGVVLDLMIHDLDIVLKLAGSKIARVDAVGVSVIGQVEDICNARITFENGCIANLTASRLAMKSERRLRVFSPNAYVSIDYQKRTGVVIHKGENLKAIREVVAKVRSGELTDLSQVNYAELVHIEQLPIEELDPLRTQLESFVNCVRTGQTPQVTAEDGLAAVDAATKIVAAMPTDVL